MSSGVESVVSISKYTTGRFKSTNISYPGYISYIHIIYIYILYILCISYEYIVYIVQIYRTPNISYPGSQSVNKHWFQWLKCSECILTYMKHRTWEVIEIDLSWIKNIFTWSSCSTFVDVVQLFEIVAWSLLQNFFNVLCVELVLLYVRFWKNEISYVQY